MNLNVKFSLYPCTLMISTVTSILKSTCSLVKMLSHLPLNEFCRSTIKIKGYIKHLPVTKGTGAWCISMNGSSIRSCISALH